jgi:hypothetical protein
MHRTLFAAVMVGLVGLAWPGTAFSADDGSKTVVPPQPTINLSMEQRFIIRENIKEMRVPRAGPDAPDKIGERVPQNIDLHALPRFAKEKVPQAKYHKFFIKDGDNVIVLVSPDDRRVADVIPLKPGSK